MALPLVSLALDYYRNPLAFRHLSEAGRPLPEGFEALFVEFCAALVPMRIAETSEQFATEPEELAAAARFFVRHVLLNPESDHYRCLGLSRRASPETIRRHYQLLIGMFHPDRGVASNEFWASIATRINLAYQTLRDDGERLGYDLALPEYDVCETTLAWFFQAQAPVATVEGLGDWRGLTLGNRPNAPILLLAGFGLLVVVVSTLYLLSVAHEKPALRLASSGSSETQAPVPNYLSPSLGQAPLEPSPLEMVAADIEEASLPEVVLAQAPSPPRPSSLPESGAPLNVHIPPADARRAPDPVAAQMASSVVPADEPGPDAVSSTASRKALDAAETKEPTLAETTRPSISPPITRVAPRPIPSLETADRGRSALDRSQPQRPEAAAETRMPAKRESRHAPPKKPPKSDRLADTRPASREAPRASPGRSAVDRTSRASKSPTAPARIASAATAPKSAKAASGPTLPPDRYRPKAVAPKPVVSAKPTAIPTHEAQSLISRLESAYSHRDARAYAALFTARAQVNEGRGRDLIRSTYAGLFQKLETARLSIGRVEWRPMSDGSLRGSGAASVSYRRHGSSAWEHARARMDFVVTRDAGRYRIASMIYKFK